MKTPHPIRRLTNALKGRSKSVDEEMDFNSARSLIQKLPDSIAVRVSYEDFGGVECKPADAAVFLNDKFKPNPFSYSDVRRQVFRGNGQEKQYIDFEKVNIQAIIGNRKLIGSPYAKTSVSFVMPEESEDSRKS